MFKNFKNIKKLNRLWLLLNNKYFNDLDGKIGNTVIKIEEDQMSGNNLLVKSDNENVKSILKKNESQILNDIHKEIGTQLLKINII